MTKTKRAAFVLFAATASTAVAAADPSPTPALTAIQPRALATGAPACGNVGYKYMGPPVCRTARTIVRLVAQQIEEIRETAAVFDWIDPGKSSSLTLAEVGRPRS